MITENEIIKLKFRGSMIGQLMTEPQGKSPIQKYKDANEALAKLKEKYAATANKETKTAKNDLQKILKKAAEIKELEKQKDDIHLSSTCMNALVNIYRGLAYNRAKEIKSKHTKKGTWQEEDALTLLSVHDSTPYFKNEENFSDELFTGTPDIIYVDGIKKTIDTKCSWTMDSFPHALSTVEKAYIYQGHIYMRLTGSQQHTIAYCLVNTPPELITDEIRRLQFKMGVIDPETDETFIEEAKKIEIAHIFDMKEFMERHPYHQLYHKPEEWEYDVPLSDRVIKFVLERDDSAIEEVAAKVPVWRQWIIENLLNSNNIINL